MRLAQLKYYSRACCDRDIVPPTINHEEGDDIRVIIVNFTFNKAQKRVNAALSNTFGFGGHNASVIVKKYKA